MSDAHTALEAAIRTYLSTSSYMPRMFILQMTSEPDTPEAQTLKAGLRAAIDGSNLSPERFEMLTNSVTDTQEQVDTDLAELWSYAFEDGEEPDLPW